MQNIIICGIDRLGKSSLIEGIQHKVGPLQAIHYQKPEKLNCLDGDLKKYQEKSFYNMFHLLSGNASLILDRAHLGEFVYSPRYRSYDGSYVFDLEKHFVNCHNSKFHEKTLLVLLWTSSFDFLEDDGQSLDFNKKEEEQDDFIRAFERSIIKNKILVNATDETGKRKTKEQILERVMTVYNHTKL